jgi:hypothetical protein
MMVRNKWLRYTIGIILGGCAGLSLTTTILPTALAAGGLGESFIIRWELADYAAHTVIAWASGAWVIVRVGIPWTGALILGTLGLASGALLCSLAIGTDLSWLLFTAVAGGAYGSIGSLLLGHVLQSPPADAA